MEAMRALCTYVRSQKAGESAVGAGPIGGDPRIIAERGDSGGTGFKCDTLSPGDIALAMGGDEDLQSYWKDTIGEPARCTKVHCRVMVAFYLPQQSGTGDDCLSIRGSVVTPSQVNNMFAIGDASPPPLAFNGMLWSPPPAAVVPAPPSSAAPKGGVYLLSGVVGGVAKAAVPGLGAATKIASKIPMEGASLLAGAPSSPVSPAAAPFSPKRSRYATIPRQLLPNGVEPDLRTSEQRDGGGSRGKASGASASASRARIVTTLPPPTPERRQEMRRAMEQLLADGSNASIASFRAAAAAATPRLANVIPRKRQRRVRRTTAGLAPQQEQQRARGPHLWGGQQRRH